MSSQTLAALPDQDSFYDVTDCLEQLGMESIVQKHMTSSGIEADLKQQFTIYEVNSLNVLTFNISAVWLYRCRWFYVLYIV